ncbi:hypothetical protein RI367_001269 [Sorochytrium milnesiophthora]
MADKQSASGQKEGKVVNTVHKNAILAETIKKEMRKYDLYDKYSVTTNVKQNIVLTTKPNTTNPNKNEAGGVPADGEYLALMNNISKLPRDKWSEPQTTAQELFWETKQLNNHNLTNPLFHHPRKASEITKYYGASQ